MTSYETSDTMCHRDRSRPPGHSSHPLAPAAAPPQPPRRGHGRRARPPPRPQSPQRRRGDAIRRDAVVAPTSRVRYVSLSSSSCSSSSFSSSSFVFPCDIYMCAFHREGSDFIRTAAQPPRATAARNRRVTAAINRRTTAAQPPRASTACNCRAQPAAQPPHDRRGGKPRASRRARAP